MKKKILVTLLVLLFALTGCGGAKEQDKVLAVVNGKSITQSEFDKRYNIIAGQYTIDEKSPEQVAYREELRKQVLNSMIDELLLIGEAEKRGLTISEADLDKEMQNFKSSFSSQEEFLQYIKEFLNVTEAEFRVLLRNDILISDLYDQVTADVTLGNISPREYFAENKESFQRGEEVAATHILVNTEAEAKALIQQIQQGADMNQLAREKSIDPSAKVNGGDLGYFPRGQMVPEFETVAFSLTPGQLHPEPVQSSFGYHVIRTDSRLAPEEPVFEDVEEEIIGFLMEEAKGNAFMAFISSLREGAAITIS